MKLSKTIVSTVAVSGVFSCLASGVTAQASSVSVATGSNNTSTTSNTLTTTSSTSSISSYTVPVYQATNPTTGATFLSTSAHEVSSAAAFDFTVNNGVAFTGFSSAQAQNGLVAVHRLYNPTHGFVYMAEGVGLTNAVNKYGYTDEKIEFYASINPSSGSVPVYRLLNSSGRYVFTTNKVAKDTDMAKSGWSDGAVAFYANPVLNSTSVPFAVTHATNGKKMVFAHWFPPMPRSIDNADPNQDYYSSQYLNPAGENNAHKDEGGFLRDRPLGREPIVNTGNNINIASNSSAVNSWSVEDMKAEISMAKQSGIDGFEVDILDWNGPYWQRFQDMLTAADQVGDFSIVPQPDMAVDFGKLSSSDMAKALASVANHPSIYKMNGRMMFAPFLTENQTPAYWSDVIRQLKNTYNINPYFMVLLLDSGEQNIQKFASIADGFSDWGVRDSNKSEEINSDATLAHSMGKTWMAPVSPGDYSPAEKVYDESRGAQTLQNTWDRAQDENADMVEVDTWNDFSESTGIAPSQDHGWSFADVNAYYATRYHNGGAAPAMAGDEAIVVSRTQKVGDTMGQVQPAQLRYGSNAATAPNDEVEGVVMLKSPATVVLTSGQHTATVNEPAGFNVVRVPLDFGTPNISVVRNGITVATASLSKPVVQTAPVQDLTYWATSSRAV